MESKQPSSARVWLNINRPFGGEGIAISEKALDAHAKDRIKSLERENQSLRKVFDLAKSAVTPGGTAYWNDDLERLRNAVIRVLETR